MSEALLPLFCWAGTQKASVGLRQRLDVFSPVRTRITVLPFISSLLIVMGTLDASEI